MLAEPGRELLPKLGICTLAEPKVKQMNAKEVRPQVPTSHQPHTAEDDRGDDKAPSRKANGVTGTADEGQEGNSPADHESMLVRRQC